jgi:hypothetical protein
LFVNDKEQAGAELCKARTQVDLLAEATAEGKLCIFLNISSYLGHFPFNSSHIFSKIPKNISTSREDLQMLKSEFGT